MEQEGPFKERRKYVRLQATVQVNYKIIGKPGAVEVFSKNISAGGLCVVADKELSPDTPLQLEIKIPDLKAPIQAIGRVVWQNDIGTGDAKSIGQFETGIEFTGISDFDRFNINRYVLDRVEK